MHTGQDGSQVECMARNLRLAPALAINLPVCRRVQIREIIDRFCPLDNKRDLTHGQVAEFMILHLLQSAQRLPLYHLQHWAEHYHLNLLYACPPEAFNDDRIGRALDALYQIVQYELTGSDGQLALRFGIDEQALAAAAQGDGRYILIADLPEASPDGAFRLFKRQAIIEHRFRNLKTDLSVHPIWLQHEHRIHALLLLFVLALVVYTLLELRSERAGLSTERYHKMTARELIWRFAVVDLVEIRIRGQPTEYQLTLSTEQQYLLGELNFPDLAAYLKLA